MIKFSAYLKLIATKAIRGGLIVEAKQSQTMATLRAIDGVIKSVSLHFDGDVTLGAGLPISGYVGLFNFLKTHADTNIVVTGATKNYEMQHLLRAAIDGEVFFLSAGVNERFQFTGSVIIVTPSHDSVPSILANRSLICSA